MFRLSFNIKRDVGARIGASQLGTWQTRMLAYICVYANACTINHANSKTKKNERKREMVSVKKEKTL